MEKYFVEFIKSIIPISDTEIGYILDVFELIKVPKNKIVLQKGSVCQYIYFIAKGSMRCYYLNEEEHVATRFIGIENQFCTSLASFIEKTPSIENIETIEDCVLLKVNRNDFYELLDKAPVIEKLYRIILERIQIHNMWRLEILTSKTPMDKYLLTEKYFPHLFGRVKNVILASYIAITPETFSRLKIKMMKQTSIS